MDRLAMLDFLFPEHADSADQRITRGGHALAEQEEALFSEEVPIRSPLARTTQSHCPCRSETIDGGEDALQVAAGAFRERKDLAPLAFLAEVRGMSRGNRITLQNRTAGRIGGTLSN
jgi:hypothetical protein